MGAPLLPTGGTKETRIPMGGATTGCTNGHRPYSGHTVGIQKDLPSLSMLTT